MDLFHSKCSVFNMSKVVSTPDNQSFDYLHSLHLHLHLKQLIQRNIKSLLIHV